MYKCIHECSLLIYTYNFGGKRLLVSQDIFPFTVLTAFEKRVPCSPCQSLVGLNGHNMERLCFDERDAAFHRTTASPCLPPPLLGKDGKISFPPQAGFGAQASHAPYAPPAAAHPRMQFVAASNPLAHAPPPVTARLTVQIDDHEAKLRAPADGAQMPQTPTTPNTPTTPLTPLTPGEGASAAWGQDAETNDGDHPVRSPEMPPDDAASFTPGMEDDAGNFAPGADDAGDFAPGAEYAASSSYAPASSGYGANEYAPEASPQVRYFFAHCDP